MCHQIKKRKCIKPLKIQINQLCMQKRTQELQSWKAEGNSEVQYMPLGFSWLKSSKGMYFPSMHAHKSHECQRDAVNLERAQNLGLEKRKRGFIKHYHNSNSFKNFKHVPVTINRGWGGGGRKRGNWTTSLTLLRFPPQRLQPADTALLAFVTH